MQAAFEQDGYVILPCLSEADASTLISRYDELPAVPQRGFFTGLFSENEAFKRGCHDLLVGIGQDFAAKHLVDYRPLVGSFVVKIPGLDGEMTSHQDWTFVNEREFCSLNVWCALTDTNEENGAMYLLPGSHRLAPNIRGTQITPPIDDVGDIPCEDMVYVPLKAGQAIVHDHRVLHRSPPNRSNRRRMATAICMVPTQAEVVHYFRNPVTGRLEVYRIGTEFFFHYTYGISTIPPGTEFLRFADEYRPVPFTQDMIDELRRSEKSRSVVAHDGRGSRRDDFHTGQRPHMV